MWNEWIIVDEGGFGGFGAPRLKFCEKKTIFFKIKMAFYFEFGRPEDE